MNSKSVIVIDTPNSCDQCPMFGNHYTDMTCKAIHKTIDYPCPKDFKQSWCPLLLLPERINLKQYIDNTSLDLKSILAYQYAQGFNNCIDIITEEYKQQELLERDEE